MVTTARQPTVDSASLTVTVRSGDGLHDDERRVWQALQRDDVRLHTPYLHPRFTEHVAAVRDDVQVAVVRRGDEPVAFLPFQARRGHGRPVAGRLNDYQGLVASPYVDVGLDEVVARAGLATWSFTHVLPGSKLAEWHVERTIDAPQIDLSDGFDAYAARRREAGSKRLKKIDRKGRGLERDVGPLRFDPDVDDPDVFRQLLAWKSQQYRNTGLQDVFSHDWTVRLLERLHATRDDEFGGCLSALRAGDRLVAVEFGMRCHGVYHSWFPAYDPELSKYSAGNVLLVNLLRSAAARGIRRVDLGPGTGHGKDTLATGAVVLRGGAVVRDPVTRLLRRAGQSAKQIVKATPLGVAAKLVRPLREWREFR